MTIIDELLILLDDLGDTLPESIPNYFVHANKQMIFSSLGRLVNRGWVQKKQKREQSYYAITVHGVAELNKTLDSIKKEAPTEWDRRWRLVIFDVPESKRKLRDTFRVFLKSEGFGILKSSVWITPWDKKEEVKRFAKRHNLSDHLVQIETGEMTDSYQSVLLAQQSWDWQDLEKAYREYLAMGEKELGYLQQTSHQQRYKAKKLVFQYAEIVKRDPLLPTDIAPNASLVRRAHDFYIRVRPYCLAEDSAT